MNFQNLTTTKLGNVGEGFISEFAKSKGAKPYIPAFQASFPVDSLCLKDGKIFSVEMKAKPRFLKYEITGYDLKDHQEYVSLQFPVYVLFCDYISRSIYGAWAKDLDKQPKSYFANGVVAFPLSAMTIYRGLTQVEVDQLKKYNQSKYYKS